MYNKSTTTCIIHAVALTSNKIPNFKQTIGFHRNHPADDSAQTIHEHVVCNSKNKIYQNLGNHL